MTRYCLDYPEMNWFTRTMEIIPRAQHSSLAVRVFDLAISGLMIVQLSAFIHSYPDGFTIENPAQWNESFTYASRIPPRLSREDATYTDHFYSEGMATRSLLANYLYYYLQIIPLLLVRRMFVRSALSSSRLPLVGVLFSCQPRYSTSSVLCHTESLSGHCEITRSI